MKESHNNHIQDCRLSTTVFTCIKLETRGWSQIQAEEKVFPNHILFFFAIDLLKVEIYCKMTKYLQEFHNKPYLRLPFFSHHF